MAWIDKYLNTRHTATSVGTSDTMYGEVNGQMVKIPLSSVANANPSGAQDYFVDLNRAEAGDGKSWDRAFTTISAAITASNLSIGLTANRWWARRNRIFVCGDGITESLTVLPEKTDIIGVGTDLYPFPRITGIHTIAAAKVGVRLINLGFQASTTGVTMTIPLSSHGLQILGCTFIPHASGSTKALMITSTACMKIQGNRFQVGGGSIASIYGLAISLEGTVLHENEVLDNTIVATAGIACPEAGGAAEGSIMARNIIRTTTGLPINDDSDDWMVVDNRMMTEINIGTTTAGYDFNLALASGNILTGLSGVAATVPFAVIAE